MKKIIFILIAIIGISFAGIKSANAQWKVKVYWNDTYCNCGTITAKTLFIKITYLRTQEVIVDWEEFDISTASSPYTAEGDETIINDCEDCYLVEARIEYEDTSVCCAGTDSDTVDGQELIDEITLNITMY